MKYQIICLKNKSFWNSIILFVAFFVVAVYVISLVMPTPREQITKDGALYQQIEQQTQDEEDNESQQG